MCSTHPQQQRTRQNNKYLTFNSISVSYVCSTGFGYNLNCVAHTRTIPCLSPCISNHDMEQSSLLLERMWALDRCLSAWQIHHYESHICVVMTDIYISTIKNSSSIEEETYIYSWVQHQTGTRLCIKQQLDICELHSKSSFTWSVCQIVKVEYKTISMHNFNRHDDETIITMEVI